MSLRLVDVTFRYPRSKGPALAGVSLEIPAGSTTAVLGPSGAGKSTLLNLLGLLWEGPLDGGEIYYQDTRYSALGPRQRARLRLEHFGFVFQSSSLIPHLTCAQNIELPLALNGVPATLRSRAVRTLVEELGAGTDLLQVLHRRVKEVSGGERQRVAVLRALIHDPRVVFADEPVSNLDQERASLVLELLGRWRDGVLSSQLVSDRRTLVLVDHDIEEAYRVSDHFAVLHAGRVTAGQGLRKSELPGGPEVLRRLVAFSGG